MTNFVVSQAQREKIYVKVALMGASGSGKTYSSLRLATGMLDEMKAKNLDYGNGKILMANTESSRGRYYANEFKYDIVDIGAPHTPENYVELINWAVAQKYPILIIDSASHEWIGRGGCLDIHQQSGGTFQAWAKVTPRHNKFIEAIADSKIHLIANMRAKEQFEIEKEENGKTNVRKLGVGAEQRSGYSYEFTDAFLLDQKTNMASCEKDNSHLFENEGEVKISEDYGKKLIDWANSGEGYTPPVRFSGEVESGTTHDLKDEVTKLSIAKAKINREKVVNVVAKYEKSGNPKKMTDEVKMQQLKDELELITE